MSVWRVGGWFLLGAASCLALWWTGSGCAQDKTGKGKGIWTNPDDPSLPADFKVQGEYAGAIQSGRKLGCQVIALGNGAFQAVIYPGGLPGAGWDGKHRVLMDGKFEGDRATFTPTTGKRKYKARKPEEFSATNTFPPPGQKDYVAAIRGEMMTGKTDDGKTFELKKTVRRSPSLGARPTDSGAIVLFDGGDTKEWTGGRLDAVTKLLNTDGKDIVSKRKFNNYTMHLEFMTPYRPEARDQQRGNSGFYQVDLYEVQILDSFGLDGKNNECGGIYSKRDSSVNMCLPPLTWQTYDVDFTNAVREGDKKTKNARITMKLNGVVIHDDVEITGPTGGGRNEKEEGTPGPIKLQGHGNPLQFRNVWIVEKAR